MALRRAAEEKLQNKNKKVNKRNQKRKHASDEELEQDEIVVSPTSPLLEEDVVPGIIEKITLKNFMCHSNLEFVFGPHVNFVIGRNGSGKSAVLNGIIVGLGGKSYLTGRSTNLKGFIQNGKQHAHISITLKNSRIDGYRYSDYGSRIIVERRIQSEGPGTYKLKGIGGKLVSSKREELSNILAGLNIQVDNPVAILTQDASRTFLGSKEPKKKYSFFCKATQLEMLVDQYEKAKVDNIEAKRQLECRRQTLPENEKEVKKWEERQKNLNSLNEQELRVQELENEYLWSIAIAAEKQAKMLKDCRDRCAKVVNKTKSEIDDWEKQYSQKCDKVRHCKHELKAFDDDIIQIKREIVELSQVQEKLSQESKIYQLNSGFYERECQEARNDVKSLQKVLEEAKLKSLEDSDEVRKNQKKLKEECMKKKELLHTESDRVLREIGIVTKKSETIESEMLNKIQEIKSCNYKIMNKRTELQSMKSSYLGKPAIYDPKMPELLRKIENCQRFCKKPLGPIGMYLEVRVPKWSFAVEVCLKNHLLSFCCDNVQDRKVLLDIIREVQGMRNIPNIIVSKFSSEVYNISPHRVRSFPAVFDVINCNEPTILNCLIDQVHIERILLIQESSEASDLMLDSPPQNCLSAFTLIGDQLFPAPKYRYYSCKQSPSVRYLRDNFTKEDIDVKERELQLLVSEAEHIKAEKKKLENLITENKIILGCLGKKFTETKKEIIQTDEKIKEIEAMKVSDNDIPSQEEELEHLMQWESRIAKEIEFRRKKLKEKQTELSCINQKYKTKRILLSAKREEVNKFQDDLGRFESDLTIWENKKDRLNETLKSDMSKLCQAKLTLDDADTEASKCLSEAAKLCPRIDTERRGSDIQSELIELKKVLSEHTKDLNREEVEQNYVEFKKKLETMKLEIKENEELIKRMKRRIDQRLEKLKNMRKDITLQVNYHFQANMSKRKYLGRLKFDHEIESLEIEACSKEGKTSLHKTNMLSGGERSFVTVSLLLALYNVTQLPYHILDEYDVFMDDTNKAMSMKIMLEMAQSQAKSQFIFLSPLELPSNMRGNVKVHKMPDPKRTVDSDEDSS